MCHFCLNKVTYSCYTGVCGVRLSMYSCLMHVVFEITNPIQLGANSCEQLVMKFLSYTRTQKYINVFTTALYRSVDL